MTAEPGLDLAASGAVLIDRLGRPLSSLRISVTDRCNLRCAYCMPERQYRWLPHSDVLTFDEIAVVVEAVTRLGVSKIRLTGGEPLRRRDLTRLVKQISAHRDVGELAMTTNGVLLAEHAAGLRAAGLDRVTVSLDTLRPLRFAALAGRDAHHRVLAGIAAARAAGFPDLKIDTVVVRGVNDDELMDLLAFGREVGAEVRFIEYMDVGGATRWATEKVVSRAEMLEAIEGGCGPAEPMGDRGSRPAERFRRRDGTTFGIIASTTAPFCGACDRARLTADGGLYPCLYARAGLSLRELVRGGAGPGDVAARIAELWAARDARGAEQRLAIGERGPLLPAASLRRQPHLEMHMRGG